MTKLSVVIITKNEAKNIGNALESVSWADDIVVVDSGSTDTTIEIAKRYTDRVTAHEWAGYGAQKDYAAGLALNDWVLSLDADERISSSLASEIRDLLQNGPDKFGYRIPRVTHYLGRWIRSTDWYPDYQLRLFDRRVARWNRLPVHESVDNIRLTEVGHLRGEIEHFPYHEISDHLDTIDHYTSLAAAHMQNSGRKVGWLDLVSRAPVAFVRNYIVRGGYKDGLPGLMVSALNTYYVFLKFAKLWEKQHTKSDEP